MFKSCEKKSLVKMYPKSNTSSAVVLSCNQAEQHKTNRKGKLSSEYLPTYQKKMEVITMMEQKELAAIIRSYHSAKIAADKVKYFADLLKAEAKERGTEELKGGGFKVTVKDVTSTTLDSKALKADKPELWETYSKTSTTTRIYIK